MEKLRGILPGSIIRVIGYTRCARVTGVQTCALPISPYGIGLSEFDNPEYEKQMQKLKVDIIAYQDEVGHMPLQSSGGQAFSPSNKAITGISSFL